MKTSGRRYAYLLSHARNAILWQKNSSEGEGRIERNKIA
jgi:hypothetical protein